MKRNVQPLPKPNNKPAKSNTAKQFQVAEIPPFKNQ